MTNRDNKQIKAPKRVKIIAGLMFVIGFGIGLWCIVTLITTSLMWTTPPGGPTSVSFGGFSSLAIYITDTLNLFFIVPLFIIASIGLWKIKEWGLFLALIAFSGKIFLEVGLFAKSIADLWWWDKTGTLTENAGIIIEGKNLTWIDVVWFDSWMYLPTLCILIFVIVSIVYLWRNRRYFFN